MQSDVGWHSLSPAEWQTRKLIIEAKLKTDLSHKEFIIECLESVENQLYNNYEIIIINDGSNDISIIENYLHNKNNYKIINKKINEGPASSKWTFIKYLQENINLYSYNDIVIIIDGDDYLIDNNALNIINKKYNSNNCWITYGNCVGAFSDGYDLDISTLKNKSFRKNKWIYNHPRTFKLFTVLNLKEDDFKYNNKWLTKGTDRPLLYNILELSGHEHIKNINEKIYYYREHSNNSYKTVDMHYKKEQLNYIINKKESLKINEDIHVVMCSWKRIKAVYQVRYPAMSYLWAILNFRFLYVIRRKDASICGQRARQASSRQGFPSD